MLYACLDSVGKGGLLLFGELVQTLTLLLPLKRLRGRVSDGIYNG